VKELGRSVADELLEVHRCYLGPVWPLMENGWVHAMAHITGGGLTDNLPRVLPDGLRAVIKVGAWEIPPVFRLLAEKGQVPEDDLWRTFNLGVGMVLVVPPKQLEKALRGLRESGCAGFPMGTRVRLRRFPDGQHRQGRVGRRVRPSPGGLPNRPPLSNPIPFPCPAERPCCGIGPWRALADRPVLEPLRTQSPQRTSQRIF
jgi:hypothetical protein